MSARDCTNLIELREVGFEYLPGLPVLRGVALELQRRTIYGLVGPNGAGKTTLVRMIRGDLSPTVGEVLRHSGNGRPLKIQMVEQHLSLFGDLSVAENFAAIENEALLSPLSLARTRRQCVEALAALGLRVNSDLRAGDLAFPERQLVEVARALSAHPDLLILDEPTSSLDGEQKERLYAVLRGVAREGSSIVLVSHDPGEVASLADVVLHLVDGQFVPGLAWERDDDPPSELDDESARGRGPTGRTCGASVELPGQGRRVDFSVAGSDCAVLALEDAPTRNRVAQAIAFEGAMRVSGCRTGADGRDVRGRGKPRQEVMSLLADRRRFGVFPALSVEQQVGAIVSARDGRPLLAAWRNPEELGAVLLSLRVNFRDSDQCMDTLSGGNQHKVLLGAALVARPDVLVVEEPLLGLDLQAQHDAVAALRGLGAEGTTVVVLTAFPRQYRENGLNVRSLTAIFAEWSHR